MKLNSLSELKSVVNTLTATETAWLSNSGKTVETETTISSLEFSVKMPRNRREPLPNEPQGRAFGKRLLYSNKSVPVTLEMKQYFDSKFDVFKKEELRIEKLKKDEQMLYAGKSISNGNLYKTYHFDSFLKSIYAESDYEVNVQPLNSDYVQYPEFKYGVCEKLYFKGDLVLILLRAIGSISESNYRIIRNISNKVISITKSNDFLSYIVKTETEDIFIGAIEHTFGCATGVNTDDNVDDFIGNEIVNIEYKQYTAQIGFYDFVFKDGDRLQFSCHALSNGYYSNNFYVLSLVFNSSIARLGYNIFK